MEENTTNNNFLSVETLKKRGTVIIKEYSVVPNKWVLDGYLFWPNKNLNALQKDCNSEPVFGEWGKSRCVIKQCNINKFEEGLLFEEQYSIANTTEDEANIQHSVQKKVTQEFKKGGTSENYNSYFHREAFETVSSNLEASSSTNYSPNMCFPENSDQVIVIEDGCFISNPSCSETLGNLGSVLSAQGRYEEAKIALLEALKFRPNMADVHYNLGIILQNQQDYKGAIESFQKAIHFRPSLALAYLNLGTSLIALGRCQEAAAVLREGSKLDGTGLRDRDAHENARIASLLQLGNLYADQGKLQRALAVYREALHSLPDRYPPQSIYHRLGDILSRLHQWNEAERFHRAALEVEPNHVATHLSYGTMLARNSSRASEAEQWFKRALRLAPTDSSVYHHYAEFLTSVSRHKEACEQRIRAAELSPKDYSLVVSAATALRLLDKKNDAEKWYRKAVQLRPDDARAHTNLGAILHLIGRTNDAAVSYREALKLQPGDPTTLANLAKLGIMEVA